MPPQLSSPEPPLRAQGRTRRLGVKDVELSWILEDNAGMRSIIESIGGHAYKRYRIYERQLTEGEG